MVSFAKAAPNQDHADEMSTSEGSEFPSEPVSGSSSYSTQSTSREYNVAHSESKCCISKRQVSAPSEPSGTSCSMCTFNEQTKLINSLSRSRSSGDDGSRPERNLQVIARCGSDVMTTDLQPLASDEKQCRSSSPAGSQNQQSQCKREQTVSSKTGQLLHPVFGRKSSIVTSASHAVTKTECCGQIRRQTAYARRNNGGMFGLASQHFCLIPFLVIASCTALRSLFY